MVTVGMESRCDGDDDYLDGDLPAVCKVERAARVTNTERPRDLLFVDDLDFLDNVLGRMVGNISMPVVLDGLPGPFKCTNPRDRCHPVRICDVGDELNRLFSAVLRQFVRPNTLDARPAHRHQLGALDTRPITFPVHELI